MHPMPAVMRRHGALPAFLAAMLLLVLGPAPAAQAHNALISSFPEDGATVDSMPERVTLTFNAEVGEGGNGIVVTGPQGASYSEGDVSIDGSKASVALAPLQSAGEYTVSYRIISADGHPLEDELTFTLPEQAVAAPQETAQETAADSTPTSAAPDEPHPDATSTSLTADEASETSSPTSAMGPVVGAIVAIAIVALIVILLIRIRRGGSGGTSSRR
ncbi:copper resistance CopC family protein [Salinactinospora qingdaonensis]|uniref:CopC domain-containing protein n=1 Tax=Salinactinospora qingdaonensis TaxID=702744 RepID=A0ABP7FZP3_9ACTN